MKEHASEANWKDRMGLQDQHCEGAASCASTQPCLLQDNLARMLRESGNFSGAEFYFKEKGSLACLSRTENGLEKCRSC